MIKNKSILLTGGGSGIGRALAAALAAKGANLMLAGRRAGPLEETAAELRGSGSVSLAVADVTDPQARHDLVKAAIRQMGEVDILINNAGGVRAGRLEQIEAEDLRRMIDVNLIAPIMLSREVIPFMRARGSGLIVNITSGIALIGMPFYATYAASKAGLARFGEALRRELSGEGIGVLTVYPGATDTPMMTSSNAGPELGFTREKPADVADAVVAAIERGNFDVVRGGQRRQEMLALNQNSPEQLDEMFLRIKPQLEEAVRDHRAL